MNLAFIIIIKINLIFVVIISIVLSLLSSTKLCFHSKNESTCYEKYSETDFLENKEISSRFFYDLENYEDDKLCYFYNFDNKIDIQPNDKINCSNKNDCISDDKLFIISNCQPTSTCFNYSKVNHEQSNLYEFKFHLSDLTSLFELKDLNNGLFFSFNDFNQDRLEYLISSVVTNGKIELNNNKNINVFTLTFRIDDMGKLDSEIAPFLKLSVSV